MVSAVIDTCVLVSAMRSRRGASHRLIRSIGDPRWWYAISAPLVLEYEEQAVRCGLEIGVPADAVNEMIDWICEQGTPHTIYFNFRPELSDPDDELVLDLALAAGAKFIVTHNIRDFRRAERFGIRVVTPREFLATMEEE